jgi:acetyltransferase
VAVNQQRRKPIVCNLMTDRIQWAEVVRILQDGDVPAFALPGEAARAIAALVRYHTIRSRDAGQVTAYDDIDQPAGAAILTRAKKAGRRQLKADEVYDLLTAYRIPVADWRMVDEVDGAVAAADAIGYPVVVKADAASVIHKSDMGGVSLNLPDAAAVREAAASIKSKLDADDLRFFVQRHMPSGLEVIMGTKAEPGLGHMVMFGLGGIYVEIMKDVVFNLTPVTDTEAKAMLSGIKGAALLKGVRGQAGVDREMLLDIIQRLSQLVVDLPEIREMDLNPVIAYEDGVCIVDARITI